MDDLSLLTGEGDSKSDTTTPEIDMSGLTMQQQEVVRKMLKEETTSFAKSGNDIGCIEGLEMVIDYVSVPKATLSRGKALH